MNWVTALLAFFGWGVVFGVVATLTVQAWINAYRIGRREMNER